MIKLINKTDKKISFSGEISTSLANAIRRSVNEIPVLAIDTLEITKNDSALYDEIISQRMGLVPLKNEDLRLPEECDCGKEDGCGKCSTKFKLSKTGPCVVYSNDLSPKESIEYKMPITILDKEQEIEFVAIAKMGQGIRHAKFSPGLFFYRYSEDLDTNKEDTKFKKLVEDNKKNVTKEIIVNIESWGQMSAKDIFIGAIKSLTKNLKELDKKIK
jgi:DNA-directed RNA polymerase subunit D